MAAATLKACADYLRKSNETLKEFTEQWKSLSDTDKEQIKQGIGDGTYSY